MKRAGISVATRFLVASASPFGEFFLRFLRTVLLSHVLSPSDVGATVVLVSVLTSCEMITDIGLDKFVLLKRGDAAAQAVAAARQISIIRGVVLGAVIAIGAPAFARIYGTGEHYQVVIAWLGLVPLIAGFRNWRVTQVQQEYRYGVEAISNLGGHVGAIMVIGPVVLWIHDARVMLASLLVEAIVYVLLSNLVLRRERVAAIDRTVRSEALTFGLPLIANGLALIVIRQSDQVIVANLFNLSTLALYSLVLSLAIAPTSVALRIAWKISIPFLAPAHSSPELSRAASSIVLLGVVVAAAAYALSVGLVLDSLIPIVYGPGYAATPVFCGLVTLIAFTRFCRGGPNLVFVSLGETGRLTIGNLAAGSGAVLGLLLGFVSRDINGVLIGFATGDLLSFVVLVCLLRRHLLIKVAAFHLTLLGTAVIAMLLPLAMAPASHLFEARAIMHIISMIIVGADVAAIYRSVDWSVISRILPTTNDEERDTQELPTDDSVGHRPRVKELRH